ncbi:MAG: hypothetical protein HGB02_03755 [Chlorobiaceae bacterium]|nr:hypothetical protein [Chlorobiaceae bacterium]
MADYGLFEMLDFETPEFDLDFDTSFLEEHENRYINPKKAGSLYVPERHVKFNNAVEMAKAMEIGSGTRSHAIVSGNFIFGDFIEALFVERNIHTKKLSVSTLSLSDENIDSFSNLLDGGYVDSLDLIVSDYFHANERHGLVPYMLQELDKDDRFQLAVASSHTKIVIFETDGGKKFVIHGSANLRSSACVEQFTIEENPEYFDFCQAYHDVVLKEYAIINKSLRRNKLWQVVEAENGSDTTRPGAPTRKSVREKTRTSSRTSTTTTPHSKP